MNERSRTAGNRCGSWFGGKIVTFLHPSDSTAQLKRGTANSGGRKIPLPMEMPVDAFPVDVHVQRFAISNGIIKSSGKVLNEEVERILRPLLCEIVLEKGWSALEMSHAIWFLGNRLCSGCYRDSIPKILCPSYGHCGGSISTITYFRRGFWDLGVERHRKGGSSNFALPESSPLFL